MSTDISITTSKTYSYKKKIEEENKLQIDFFQKLKLGKTHGILITPLCNLYISSASKDLISSLKSQKNKYSSASDWWKCTKSHLKKNARTFPKNPTVQQNIRISRLKEWLKNLYKKEKQRPILLLNLDYKLYTSILQRMRFLNWISFSLPFGSLVTGTNSFTWFKLLKPISNLKLK